MGKFILRYVLGLFKAKVNRYILDKPAPSSDGETVTSFYYI